MLNTLMPVVEHWLATYVELVGAACLEQSPPVGVEQHHVGVPVFSVDREVHLGVGPAVWQGAGRHQHTPVAIWRERRICFM